MGIVFKKKFDLISKFSKICGLVLSGISPYKSRFSVLISQFDEFPILDTEI